MNTLDLSPLYRNSIGFDRFSSLFDNAFRADNSGSNYPPYNIVMRSENEYVVTLAVAGFDESTLDISTENNTLTVRGKQEKSEEIGTYLHQGIATRAFERKFNLADHVEVTNATLKNGLLSIELLREIPEKMKPRTININ